MNVGSAYLTIYPSMQGFASDISASFGKEGAAAGKSFSNGVEKGTAAMASQVGGNVQATADAVVRAELKVKTVREQQETANNRLKIAEQQLVETKAKYKEGSSQVLQAEERVRQARIKAETATDNLKSAEEELTHKQQLVKQSAEQAAQGLGTMEKKSHKLSSALAGAIGGIAATLAQQAIAAIRNLSHEMIEASDSAQKFASTLSFAGLDDSVVQQLTKSTQEYADKTIYDLGEIRSVTAQLASNGVANYEQLAQAAGNLNAVAGGSADTFSTVGLVMTQTAGAGKLTTENWNQLANAIPGATGKLEEAMRASGAFEGNFREAMANGEISADEFYAAVQQLGMSDIAQEAATSTSTIEGSVGNLKASVVGIGTTLLDSVKPFITGGITALGKTFDGIRDGLEVAIGKVQEFGQSSQFLTAIQPLFAAISGFMPQIQVAFASVMPSLMTLGNSIMPIITTAIATISPIIGTVVTLIGNLATLLAPIIANVMTLGAGLLTTLAPAFAAIMTTVQTVMPLVQTLIQVVLQNIKAIWDAVFPAIQVVAQTVFSVISAVVATAMENVQTIISVVMSIIHGDWSGAWEGVKKIASNSWDALKSIVSNGIDGVMSFIKTIPGLVKGFFRDAGQWLIDSGKALIDGFVQGIKNSISSVTDAVSSVVSKAREFFPFSPAKRGAFSGHGYTTYSGAALVGDFAKSITANSSKAVVAAGSMMNAVNGAIAHDPFTARAQFSATGGGAGAPRTLNIQNINIEARTLDDINSIEQFSSRVFDLALTM